MVWPPYLSQLGRIGSLVLPVVVIFEALNVVVWFVQSIRRDPHDQIVRCEALALATFFLGLLLLKAFDFWWPLDLIWFTVFLGFTGRVVHLGVTRVAAGKERTAA